MKLRTAFVSVLLAAQLVGCSYTYPIASIAAADPISLTVVEFA